MTNAIRNNAAFRQQILTAPWQQGGAKLPRKITGTDIDHVIHTWKDGNAFLYCEFKRDVSTWEELATRNKWQTAVYAALVQRGHSLAALCKHAAPLSRDIDVRNDVQTFNLMGCDTADGSVWCSSNLRPGRQWFDFVSSFVDHPSRVCSEVVFGIQNEK